VAVHLFEQHDEAYHIWAEAGARARPLVHVDAHHDLTWLDSPDDLSIANYVCQALKDDLVSDVVWVVPDPVLRSGKERRGLADQLNELRRDYRPPARSLPATPDRLTVQLLGRRIEIAALDELPRGLGPVLLDLDTDFLIQPGDALPWVWPGALAARLRRRGIAPELCTIAYSVEGGYTPLEWKYLGDELACEMRGGDARAQRAEGFARLRTAATARAAADVAAGERALREAAAALPDSAAPKFLLARLLAGAGRIPEARDLYRSALAVDGSYRTAYACGGFWCLNSDRPERAEREFLDSLVLEPVDGYAELGLARIAEIRRDWFAAEAWVSKALSRNPHLVDAHRMHGRLLERQRRWQDACAAYRQSLKLALHGRSPLRQPIAARRPPNQLVADVEHGRTYHRVAVLEARAGRPDAAIAAFRVGLAVDPSPPWAHARFAWLCLRRRQWTRAWRQLIAAVRAAPMSIRRTLRRGFRRSVRRLTAWRWHQGTGLVAIDYR